MESPVAPLHLPSPAPHSTNRVLGVWSVIALTWFNVSGGCFGTEQLVSAGGPLFGFVTIFIIALCFSLPCALMTSELSTAFPDNGGYGLWVRAAFGDFLGFQVSYWSWVSGMVDNAVYPVLVCDAVTHYFLEDQLSFWENYGLKCAIAILFSLPNMFTVKMAGRGLIALMAVVNVPFLILVLCSLPRFHAPHLLDHRSFRDTDWSLLLTNALWNLNGFDCSSTFAGEVKNPARTFPRAMLGCLGLVLLTYLLPLAAAIGINSPNWQTWTDGDFTKIGHGIAGRWLGILMSVCAVVSNMGLHVAELFEDSFQLMGMAEEGLMPKWFAKRSRFGTPLRAVLWSTFLITLIVLFDFNQILVVDNFFKGLALCVEFASLAKLRYTHPDLPRPNRIFLLPLPGFIIAFLISITMVVVSLISSWKSAVVNLASAVLGLLLFWLLRRFGVAEPPPKENPPTANVIHPSHVGYGAMDDTTDSKDE